VDDVVNTFNSFAVWLMPSKL